MLKNTCDAQTKITTEIRNGMIDQASSSGIEPVIGAPTASGSLVRYLTAKYTTRMLVRMPKKAVTPMMNQYSWSTCGAIVDACAGMIDKWDTVSYTHFRAHET